jgi:hypothetical protein
MRQCWGCMASLRSPFSCSKVALVGYEELETESVLEFAETDMSITEHNQWFDLAAQLAGLLKLIQTLVHKWWPDVTCLLPHEKVFQVLSSCRICYGTLLNWQIKVRSVNSNKKPSLNCYWSFFWKLKPYLNHQGAKYCGTKRWFFDLLETSDVLFSLNGL